MKTLISILVVTFFVAGFSLERGYSLIAITNLPTTYSQNFDSFPLANISWEDNSTLTGWYATFVVNGDSLDPIALNADNGSAFTPGLKNYGPNGFPERALGSLAFNDNFTDAQVFYGAGFINNTMNVIITNIAISYIGEQWRDANTFVEALAFFYRVGGTNFTPTTDNVGWTNVMNLNFNTPQNTGSDIALNGNIGANRSARTAEISGLSIAPSNTFWIRWFDNNSMGENHGFAIDDLSVTFSGVTQAEVEVSNLTGFKVELKKPKAEKILKFKSAKGFEVKGNVITSNTVTQVSYTAFGGTNIPTNLTFIEPLKFNELKKGKLFKKKGVKYQFNAKKNKAGVGITAEPVTLILRLAGSQGTNTGFYYQTNVFNNVEIK